jgi:hypothetical protein
MALGDGDLLQPNGMPGQEGDGAVGMHPEDEDDEDDQEEDDDDEDGDDGGAGGGALAGGAGAGLVSVPGGGGSLQRSCKWFGAWKASSSNLPVSFGCLGARHAKA